MGNHGGAIVAVKHFKTEGPNNVLEYTGLINLIIVKVDLAAVFTKNCALLEDYKHWSPHGLHVKCIMGVRESLWLQDYKKTGTGIISDCVQDPDLYDDVGYDQVPPVCPQDTFYTFSRGYVRVPGDKCEGGLASSYGPQKRACPYGPQQTPDLHTHLSATKDFQDGPEQRTPSWRSFP